MKPEFENPEPLRKTLREWRVTEALPPRFQEGVWRKIQQAESSAMPATTTTLWLLCKAWLATALPRPAVAAAYLSVLLLAGTAAGYWRAQQTTSHLDDELGMRYVQSVDPYQKPSRI
jgi:hypothetical protein